MAMEVLELMVLELAVLAGVVLGLALLEVEELLNLDRTEIADVLMPENIYKQIRITAPYLFMINI